VIDGPATRLPLRDLALLLLLASLWGASYSFIKLGVATIPPVSFIAGRTLIAGGLLLVVLRLRRVKLPRDRATWQKLLVQACLNAALPFTLIAWAERTIDAGLAAILNSTTPIFAFLLTWTLTRHEPVTARKAIGVAAGLGGVCLIVGLQALDGIGRDLTAQFAMLAATLCYGAAAIYSHNFRGLDPMVPAAGSLLCGAALLLPASLLIDQPWTLVPSAASLAAMLALAVCSTALAFVIYFHLLERLGVGATAQAYLRVPIGVAIGVVMLGETIQPTAWIGLICVVTGVAAVTMPATRTRDAMAEAGQPRNEQGTAARQSV
jgi:drug/metabolite transporter (DMT)-like permease